MQTGSEQLPFSRKVRKSSARADRQFSLFVSSVTFELGSCQEGIKLDFGNLKFEGKGGSSLLNASSFTDGVFDLRLHIDASFGQIAFAIGV